MLCWGSAYVPSAWMMRDLEPLASAAVRLGLAGAILVAVKAARGGGLWPEVPWRVVLWLGLTQTALFYGTTHWGIAHESAGVAAVVANTDPLFVVMLGWFILGERLSARQWSGIALGLVGAMVAASPDLASPRPTPAALVVLAGAAAWGVGTILAARHMRIQGSALGLAGWQMLAGGVMLAAASAAWEPPPGHVGADVAAISVATAALGSALPLALFYAALRSGPAGELSAFFFMVPVIGVVTAWPALGEVPGPGLAVGLAAVTIGLVLVLAPPRRRGLVRSPKDDAEPHPG